MDSIVAVKNKQILCIQAQRLGKIAEITDFLKTLDQVYNSFFFIDNIDVERVRSVKAKRNLYNSEEINESARKNLKYSFYREIGKLISAARPRGNDKIEIHKIKILSPGFWEFFGALNPLQQIRQFLNDRHERKKDNNYRNSQEKRMGEIEIFIKENELIQARIMLLKEAGVNEEEIKPLIAKYISIPLGKLGSHQDSGLIDSAFNDPM